MSREIYERRQLLDRNPEILTEVENYPEEPIMPEVLPPDSESKSGNAPQNGSSPAGEAGESISDLLGRCGFNELKEGADVGEAEKVLRTLAFNLLGSDPLRQEAVRVAAIERLSKVGIKSPARLVDAALGMKSPEKDKTSKQGGSIILEDPEPRHEPVDGAKLLEELTETFRRFIILPKHGETAAALFAVHTYLMEATEISPFLVASSPEKRCGKTLLLEVLGYLVRKPLPASNISPSAIFRAVEKFKPTLLIDEADTFLAASDEFRGLLNGGHRRATAMVVRTVGDDHDPRMFSTWSSKAIALIGALPDTLSDRSIILRLRRKKSNETVDRLQRGRVVSELEPLRRKAARWVSDNLEALQSSDPAVPEKLNDRASDNWRPLLAIADAVGGKWPERATRAALELSGADDGNDESARALLLGDLRDLFAVQEVKELTSATIVEALGKTEERPWPEWKKGKPIPPRQLARLLAPFGVQPKQIRIDGEKTRGYELEALRDTFARYLPSDPVQAVQPNVSNDLGGNSSGTKGVVEPDTIPANPLKTSYVPDVPDEDPSSGEGGTPLFREEEL